MDIPRFTVEQLNPRLAGGGIGDAFQRFVHELLQSSYPALHLFPTEGKDGAIDLSSTLFGSRTIVECKYIGKDGLTEAQKRWHTVAHNLDHNLSRFEQAVHAQYRPWYRQEPRIDEYIFCISSILVGQRQIDELEEEIANYFRTLAQKHEHLSHLCQIAIKVLEWSGICSRLRAAPHLIFRWFPLARPQGFVPLEETEDHTSFRAYLDSSKLPYYSRAEHLKTHPAPPDSELVDEEDILASLGKGETTGLVITGRGGIGKTRLTLEIGRLAQQKKWLVLRVFSRLKLAALERLAEQLTSTTAVLLVLDYIETQKDFNELVETINNLNDTYFLHIRYIASCRRSYYKNVAGTARLRAIDLSPHLTGPATSWGEIYREATTRHILEHCGIDQAETYWSLCRDNPILAVFVSYLYSLGREGDLGELLHEDGFGVWVSKRIQLSFPNTNIGRELAILMAFLPMPTESRHLFEDETYRLLFDTLANDGWIEKYVEPELPQSEGWISLHDVLADQIVLSHAKSVQVTLELFVRELLKKARASDCLRSAIVSLQRLADHSEFQSLRWLRILQDEISQDRGAWYEVRDVLISPSLLTPPESIELLSGYSDIWVGAEKEWSFQNRLGWLVRWTAEQGGSGLNDGLRSVLRSWVEKIAQFPTTSNFVLNWGLRVWPEVLRDPVLRWIVARPRVFQTHFLLVAWLESGLPAKQITPALQLWLSKFPLVPNVSFVVRSWLGAKGDPKVVEASIKAWLGKYETDSNAQFVYRSWLDAKGDPEVVEKSIERWLEEHRTTPEANFVYRSWLDAGGDKHLIEQSLISWIEIHGVATDADFVYRSWLESGGKFSTVKTGAIAWLSANCNKEQAGYLIKALAREPEIPANTIKNILTWCRTFRGHEDALWRLTQLGRHLLKDEMAEDLYLTFECILRVLLGRASPISVVERGQIETLFSYVLDAPKLREGGRRQQIDGLFIEWLRIPGSFGQYPKPHLNIQRPSYVQRVIDLVISQTLDVTADREPLERFLHWVDTWDPECKSLLYRSFDFLRHRYSPLTLWNIVQIDPISEERQDAVEWYRRSVEFGETAQYEEAIEAAQKATAIDPTLALAWRSLSINLSNLDKHEEQIEAQRKLAELTEQAGDWYGLSVAYGNAGHNEQAVDAARKAVGFDPKLADAWNSLSINLLNLGRLDEAFAAQRTAVELSGKAEEWHHLSVEYCRVGNYEQAAAAQQAVQIDPASPESWRSLAIALEQLGQGEKASAAWLKLDELTGKSTRGRVAAIEAVNSDPTSKAAWQELASTFKRLGQHKEAISIARRKLNEYPEILGAVLPVVEACVGLIPRETIDLLEMLTNLDPGNSEFWFLLCVALRKAGDPDAAIKACSKAVRIDDNRYYYWYTMGLAHEDLHQNEKAKAAYKQVLQLKPDHLKAKERLSHLT